MFEILILILYYLSKHISCDQAPNVRVPQVRQMVIDALEKHNDSYYKIDLEHLISKDWIIERYLKEVSNDVNKAAQGIIDLLHFYKKEKMAEMTDAYFPAEFYATGFIIEHGVSKKGWPVSGFCMRCLNPFNDISNEMYELGRKFLLYFLYKHRMELDSGGRVFYGAFDKVDYINLDIRFYKNVVDYMNYIPQQPGAYLVLDLDWLFKATFQLIINFLNSSAKKQIQFSSMKDINKWVDPKNIPTYVGGKYKNYRRIPDGIKSGKCLPHLKHISEEQWDTFKEINLKCIKEGMNENNVKSINKYLRYC